ncbi:dynamin family protein [Helicobacter pylori]|uniref:dynamin family protein n=1 Tax=Helicobacter pylori TaxID=210 RepID=UPI001E3DC2BE|nr:dynamin family protein [Helicobacter pylori]
MILRAQTNFVEFLEQVLEVLKEVEIDKTECSTLLASIQKQQLVIPVVGNFSVGKSTLLNRFLGSSVLPTGITPETSLATELHYSANERIEAFSNNDEETESFELNEQSFEAIKDNATEYSYLKVYLNNEALKDSTPLVFVDMPGFCRLTSSHTHAILEYLERSVHFVILTSVEEYNLTKSMVRELKNLLEFDKGLSFILSKTDLRTPFLSKTDLRTPSQVGEISHYIQEQIQDHLDLTTRLIHSNKDNNALLEVADTIDAEKLFSALYLKRLKFLNFQLQNSLKSVMESFDYSKEKALEEIQALDLGVKDIEKTYEKLRANFEEEYSSVAVNSVVKKVIEEIREQKSYLASLIYNPKGRDGLYSEIESIMQQSLIKNAKLEIEKINLSFSKDFCVEFASLNNTQLSSVFSVNVECLELGIDALSVILAKNPVIRPFAPFLSGLNPFLEELFFSSCSIIGSFLFFSDKENERAKLENLIEVKVIPEVQYKLKEVLPGLFNECLENSLKGLKDRCELEITHKKQEIALAQKEKEKQSLSNRAKEGFKNFGNMLNRNKNPEAAPKENILSDKEIVEGAEKIAKNELEKDTRLVSSHDQYEKIKKADRSTRKTWIRVFKPTAYKS